MRSYYAYRPTSDGAEPLGTDNRILFKLKTDAGARRRAWRDLGSNVRVFCYVNFYDDATFRQL